MNRNRNDRINQVQEHTLVIGIDIAKRHHYACAVDMRGRELAKSWKFSQSRDGFLAFEQALWELMEREEKTEVLIGFEATGHYWMNLASFLDLIDVPYVHVNPMHVKQSKEMDDNLQTKSDAKDARLIAKLLPNGYFSIPRRMTQTDQHLRQGSAVRERLRKEIAAVKNRMHRWIDRYFPEFPLVFKDYGQQARAVLKQTPLPSDLQKQTPEDLVRQQREGGALYATKPKMNQLTALAEQSIGLPHSETIARLEIRGLVHQLELLETHLEEILTEMKTRARELPECAFLVSIPGLSETTVSELLAETGSLQRYQHPRQLIKLAGLTLRESSSGKHRGQKKISKRGRRRLRALLFKSMLPILQNNPAFHQLYTYYHTRKDNPLTKKEAMVVLCRKLLQVAHGLSKHRVSFTPERMLRDLSHLSLQAS